MVNNIIEKNMYQINKPNFLEKKENFEKKNIILISNSYCAWLGKVKVRI